MKTLIILTAALVSGAAYGQYPDPAIQAYSDRMRGDFRSTQILEQLEELRAAQRQQQYEMLQPAALGTKPHSAGELSAQPAGGLRMKNKPILFLFLSILIPRL